MAGSVPTRATMSIFLALPTTTSRFASCSKPTVARATSDATLRPLDPAPRVRPGTGATDRRFRPVGTGAPACARVPLHRPTHRQHRYTLPRRLGQRSGDAHYPDP